MMTLALLIKAIEEDKYESVRYYIKLGINLNQFTDELDSPLKTAIAEDNLRIAKLLLLSKADPYLEENGMTAIDYAKIYGMTDMVRACKYYRSKSARKGMASRNNVARLFRKGFPA